MRSSQTPPAPISRVLLSDVAATPWPRVLAVASVILLAALLESLWYATASRSHPLASLLLIPASAILLARGLIRGAEWDLRALLKLTLTAGNPEAPVRKQRPPYSGPPIERWFVSGRSPVWLDLEADRGEGGEQVIRAFIRSRCRSDEEAAELARLVLQERRRTRSRGRMLDLRSAGLPRETDLRVTNGLISTHIRERNYRQLTRELKQYLADLGQVAASRPAP
jgi:hypothetical protein